MISGTKRLKKTAYTAKFIGLGVFYAALTWALLYSVLSNLHARGP